MQGCLIRVSRASTLSRRMLATKLSIVSQSSNSVQVQSRQITLALSREGVIASAQKFFIVRSKSSQVKSSIAQSTVLCPPMFTPTSHIITRARASAPGPARSPASTVRCPPPPRRISTRACASAPVLCVAPALTRVPALAHAFLPAPGPTPIRTGARVPAHVRPLCLTCTSTHVHPRTHAPARAPTHPRTHAHS